MHVQVQIAAAGVYWEIECASVVVYHCMLVLIPSLCVFSIVSEYNFKAALLESSIQLYCGNLFAPKCYSYSNNTASVET